jgi:zinc transport system permease protein
MLEFIIDLQFIQRGIIAGLLVALICPMIGAFLVVRRLSLISEALSHVTLTGVGFGLVLIQMFSSLLWLNPLYVGLVFAVIGAFFIERMRTVFTHFQELSIPIVLSFGVGVGVVLMSIANGFNAGLLHLLFGSIVAVTKADLLFILITSMIVLLSVMLFYKHLLSIAFDEEFAKTSGIPRRWVNLLFAIIVALTISVAMRVVGILLVSSLITIPVATSLRIAKSFKQVIIYAICIAESSMISGIIIGYYAEISTGGMVVVMSIFHLLIILGYQSFVERTGTRRTSHER